MNNEDIDKAYVSPYDEFLFAFDAKHKKTASQLKEIKKYQRIFMLRDEASVKQVADEYWDKF